MGGRVPNLSAPLEGPRVRAGREAGESSRRVPKAAAVMVAACSPCAVLCSQRTAPGQPPRLPARAAFHPRRLPSPHNSTAHTHRIQPYVQLLQPFTFKVAVASGLEYAAPLLDAVRNGTNTYNFLEVCGAARGVAWAVARVLGGELLRHGKLLLLNHCCLCHSVWHCTRRCRLCGRDSLDRIQTSPSPSIAGCR